MQDIVSALLAVSLMIGPGVAVRSPRTVTASVPPASSTTLNSQEIARRALAATATVYVFDRYGRLAGNGSGFFVAPDVLVTNHHVIASATAGYIQFATSQRKHQISRVLAVDTVNDLALLYVPQTGASSLTLAYDEAIQVGDLVYAVGAPLGLPLTVSSGHVSSLADSVLLQVTSPISPGNSGGPLINASGRVVGVVCAHYPAGQNLNLAIRVSLLRSLLHRAVL